MEKEKLDEIVLKKLNIKSGNRSFSYDNSKTFSEQNKTQPTECVL